MKAGLRTTLAASVLLFGVSAVHAQTQPLSKRAAVNGSSPIQARALTERITTTGVSKSFFVAFGGHYEVRYQIRSNGSAQVNANVFFNDLDTCGVGMSSANYVTFTCTSTIPAGGIISVFFNPNGHQGAIRNVRLRFHLVDMDKPALTLED